MQNRPALYAAGIAVAALLICHAHPAAAERTIDKGYVSTQPATKGIVLHLHGCDGLYTKGWVEAWIRHFEYSGYKVIAPDSFAEHRPAKSCAYPYPNKWEIYEIRVKQTLRAIDHIKTQYPGKPLYVWGHSEGAWLAARLPAATDGVVTSGATCGFAGGSKVYFPASVPYLALIGDEKIDHYLRDEFNAKNKTSVAATCTSTDASPNWSWRRFEGIGHIMPIWDDRIRAAIKPIIDISMTYAGLRGDTKSEGDTDYALGSNAQTAFADKYRDGENHKAFAVGSGGSYGYTVGWGNSVDAKADALIWCNKFSATPCVVYALDDEIVVGGQIRAIAVNPRRKLPPETAGENSAEGEGARRSGSPLAAPAQE